LLRERLLASARNDLGLDGATAVPGGIDHAGEFVAWPEILQRLPEMSEVARRPDDGRRPIVPLPSALGLQVGWGLSHSAHIVEVEVDTRLGRTRTLRAHGCLAVGTIHVPDLARSQAYGGIIQGIGYALHEERLVDPVTGVNVTSNLDDYRIPGIAEMPEITIDFLEEGFEHASHGGVGMAELATAGVAGAVGNAVSRAVGHRFTRFPIRPQDVVEAVR
jgi:xanthine dehydrogenase YagR molybdenum-binding subunit